MCIRDSFRSTCLYAWLLDWNESDCPLPPAAMCTLQYAELPPAPLQTTPEAEELFKRKATEVR